MVKISPEKVEGKWDVGYFLDIHTISSTPFLNEFGQTRFDTLRSEIGELLYQLKSLDNHKGVPEIVATVVKFIEAQRWKVDLIAIVPPSQERKNQPLYIIAEAVAKELGIPCSINLVRKIKSTPALKNEFDVAKRAELLKGAFKVDGAKAGSSKIVLLLDDLYRSGATMNAVVEAIKVSMQGTKVIALALTRTRKLR